MHRNHLTLFVMCVTVLTLGSFASAQPGGDRGGFPGRGGPPRGDQSDAQGGGRPSWG